MGVEDQPSTQIPGHLSPPPLYAPYPLYNLGLQKLSNLDQVSVQQRAAVIGSKFVVNNKDGEMMFYVKEDATTLEVELAGQDRPFTICLYDERDQLAITLKRGLKRFRKKKTEVFMGEELVSLVRLKRSFFGRLLHINDINDRTTLTVSGPMVLLGLSKYKFKLFTLNKQNIGSITKLWRGLGNELFTDAEDYQVRFPIYLDVRYKAAVIGACILIDIHYYSTYIRNSII